MDFDYKLEKIHTNALTLDYFLVPWDTQILEQPVAEIRHLEVKEPEAASRDFGIFTTWCSEHAIKFTNCRIVHDQVVESMFLQAQGFRFIELNYRPRMNKLQVLELPDDEIVTEQAADADRVLLAEMAGSVFQHGRFHQDPQMGLALGNRRYKTWLLNAFESPHQQVLKCLLDHEIVAFFVVEYPEQGHCFWSLTGLAPGMQGKGLGKRVWRTMMRKHQQEGIETITTSISSHNTAVLNLYASLAFRFPTPYATFHLRPTNAQH
jgi:RimJ/RimL family protein N-acetyltransferase